MLLERLLNTPENTNIRYLSELKGSKRTITKNWPLDKRNLEHRIVWTDGKDVVYSDEILYLEMSMNFTSFFDTTTGTHCLSKVDLANHLGVSRASVSKAFSTGTSEIDIRGHHIIRLRDLMKSEYVYTPHGKIDEYELSMLYNHARRHRSQIIKIDQ